MITYRIFSDKNARLSEEHPSSSGWGGRGHCAGGSLSSKRVLFAYKFPGMVCFFIVSCQENIVNRWRRSWFRNKWWGSAGQGGTVSNWCGRILVFINSAVKDKSIIYISVFSEMVLPAKKTTDLPPWIFPRHPERWFRFENFFIRDLLRIQLFRMFLVHDYNTKTFLCF